MEKKYRKKKISYRYRIPDTELEGLEALLDIQSLVSWTPYIIGEKTVSLLILAPPESGKTEAMKKIRFNKGIYILRRFTACGFIKDLRADKIPILFKHSKILGHVLTYEFGNTFTYKTESVNSTIELLNAYTEEGLANESSYWIEGDALNEYIDLKGGIITGINPFGFFTSEKTRNIRACLYKGGFISRILVFSYILSKELEKEIFNSITRGDYRAGKKFVKKIIEEFPKKRVNIAIPEKYAKKIRNLAIKLAEGYSEDLQDHSITGFRLQKILISLAKASALRDKRRIVNRRDVDRLIYLSQWLNLKMNLMKHDYPFQ